MRGEEIRNTALIQLDLILMNSVYVLTRDEEQPGNLLVYSSNTFQFKKQTKQKNNTDSDSDAKDHGLGDTGQASRVTFLCDHATTTIAKGQDEGFAVSGETHVAEYSNSP